MTTFLSDAAEWLKGELTDHMFNETVILQSATESQDAAGQKSRSWSNEVTGIAATVTPIASGGESEEEAQMRSVQDYKVNLAYNANVTTDKRFVWGSITLNITDVRHHFGQLTIAICKTE